MSYSTTHHHLKKPVKLLGWREFTSQVFHCPWAPEMSNKLPKRSSMPISPSRNSCAHCTNSDDACMKMYKKICYDALSEHDGEQVIHDALEAWLDVLVRHPHMVSGVSPRIERPTMRLTR
ncbi:hypothetical protein SCP_1202680 [Sparassis crispa]|uniref:Uncharacterized protein n=1 Tax=Sparassis crispa TaxID=139825 RepID=A0A401H0X7_9APHY|nr:hypothetical protein SCP_1202680 [Sparassis crispa]GBE88040.1 hypothetical protein SCP_1202680 [Sparassis crispa]